METVVLAEVAFGVKISARDVETLKTVADAEAAN